MTWASAGGNSNISLCMGLTALRAQIKQPYLILFQARNQQDLVGWVNIRRMWRGQVIQLLNGRLHYAMRINRANTDAIETVRSREQEATLSIGVNVSRAAGSGAIPAAVSVPSSAM